MKAQQGQARAFGYIADCARVVEDLERQAARTGAPLTDRLAAALRAEGARMVVDAYEAAVAAGIPAHD